MGKNEDDSSDFHNPNAEDFVLQPGQKRVRFSFCEPSFEPQTNPAFEPDGDPEDTMDPEPTEEELSRFKKIRATRRDSVYPMMIDNDKHIMIDPDLEDTSTQSDSNPPKEIDPFAITDFEEEPSTPWAELSSKEKLIKVAIAVGKTIALLTLLYFFVCSLDLLSKGFRLIGGRTAGEIFKQSEILQNPVVGVMIGILTTVLVQSSSTSTSIIVGMVAAGFMDVKLAIPLIMGANIGTSITNTIVSFMQAGDKAQFRRAFAGATILDMFNWLTVIVLLVIEVLTDYLYHVSKACVDVLVPSSDSGGEVKLLSALTEPFINLIIQLDESVLDCWSNPNCTDVSNSSLIKQTCKSSQASIEVVERILDVKGNLVSTTQGNSVQTFGHKCSGEFIFAGTSMSDALVGVIILLVSLFVLCTCLILIVKVLSSVLKGHVSIVIKKILNADIPYVPWITGYIAILLGALMTFLVQSSSVFTSALTPLVGLGVISLERVYPLTLGANIGTTTTAVLASFAVEAKSFRPSMQIALCHLFFNLTGILLFYPIPYLRIPIQLSKFLGNVTAEYRWFAVAYMVMMFAIVPAVFIGLSIAGSAYVIALVSIIGVLIITYLIINLLQEKFPNILPEFMRTWKWLPLPLRSLKPYDDLFMKMACCAKCRRDNEAADENDQDNFVFYPGSPEKSGQNPNTNSNSGNSNDDNINSNGSGKRVRKSNNNYQSNGHIRSRNNDNSDKSREAGSNSNGISGVGSENEGYRGSTESVIV